MRLRRRKQVALKETLHRGRIWSEDDFWQYACTDCDYGCGSRSDGWVSRITFRWLIKTATEHTHPEHWSRNRG